MNDLCGIFGDSRIVKTLQAVLHTFVLKSIKNPCGDHMQGRYKSPVATFRLFPRHKTGFEVSVLVPFTLYCRTYFHFTAVITFGAGL